MMKLSTIEKFYETVDDQWKSVLANKILEKWGYDLGSVYAYRASSNFVFIFKKEGRRYFLRFNHACERALKTVETEIEILLYLRNKPLITTQPVKSIEGKYIEVAETELGIYYAVVFEQLQGEQYEIDELNKEHFFAWGSTLGKLHSVMKAMPKKYSQNRPSWKDLLTIASETLPAHESNAINEIKLIIQWAEGLSVTKENYGVIHYDFELDNLMWSNDRIGILDFDDCSNNWFVADIAYALRDLFVDNIDLENPFFLAFMEGYTKETGVDTVLLQQLPWFMRMHDIIMFSKLIRSVDIPESPKNDERFNGLRKKLLDFIDAYRVSFEKHATKLNG